MNELLFAESRVRFYPSLWPAEFAKASGPWLEDVSGRSFYDLTSGVGALNLGHNFQPILAAVTGYLASGALLHSLDLETADRRLLLQVLSSALASELDGEWIIQFVSPAGTAAVEAAVQLARKATGRPTVVSFHGAFHGCTLGSRLLAGNAHDTASRAGDELRIPLPGADGEYPGESLTSLLRGHDMREVAGVVVETVQGEGGIRVFPREELQRLAQLCSDNDALLIIDDVQMGCGRTGTFLSTTAHGITPDIICLSKSLTACGLPLSILLIKSTEVDVWSPGEVTGTFRGCGASIVAAAAAVPHLVQAIESRNWCALRAIALDRMHDIHERYPATSVREGRGLAMGLQFSSPDIAARTVRRAFNAGVLLETCGVTGDTVKFMPNLNADEGLFREICGRVANAVDGAFAESR